MIEEQSVASLKRAFPFLKQASQKSQNLLREYGMMKSLQRGDAISSEGDACHFIAFVLSGKARVYKVSKTGREITLYHIGAGESCILTMSCILSKTAFPAFACAEEPTQAMLLPSKVFEELIASDAEWRNYAFGLLAKRLSAVMTVVEEVAFRRVDERLAEYLLAQAATKKGAPHLALTHEKIAAELGTSREVVSRLLKDFESEGLLQAQRARIRLLDEARLRSKAKKA